jgi:lipid biosynthesis B12-binding/radical SAM protein
MKIMLIASNTASTPYPVYPLGLSTVAAAMENAGHSVVQYDYLESGMSLDILSDTIRKDAPDVVGISIRNIDNVNLVNGKKYISAVKDIVDTIKKVSKVKVVLGGSGFSIMPEEILEATGADLGIVGEGEAMMVQLVSDIEQGRKPKTRCLRYKERLSSKEILSPSYDSQLMKFYLKRGGMGSIQTKRGCSLKCLYCSYPYLEGSKVRPRSPGSIINDIRTLSDEHGAKYIFFIDSVFNDDQKYYLELVKEMKKQNIYIPWTAFFKPGGITDEEVKLMKETGLHAAEIGSDASTDETLRALRKPFLFNDIVECNDVFVRNDVATGHYYMFGGPGETRKTVLEGIENLKGLKDTVSFIFMGIRILPGTGIFDKAVEKGIIAADQDMLEPVFYVEPGVGKKWLEDTLTKSFSGVRSCVFPPDSLDSSLEFMHQMGAPGSLWDTLVRKKR